MVELRVLITGSAGLIGRAVGTRLCRRGVEIVGLDPRSPDAAARGDLRDVHRLAEALDRVHGVLHLGGVSRVIDGEHNPELCWSVNRDGTARLLDLAARAANRPWVIYASSREVYGQQDVLPVPEHASLKPKNIYARSKAAAEALLQAARDAGMMTAILRFSNVYGDIHDHPDRVVPAFARVAADGPTTGGELRVDGAGCTFDFTYVGDVADGVVRVIRLLQEGESKLPPIHFVSGRQTSLGELAALALRHGGPTVQVREAPARGFDVHRFCGDPSAAERLLDWRAATDLETGFARLVADFRAAARGPSVDRVTMPSSALVQGRA